MLHANYIWSAPGVPSFFLHAKEHDAFYGLPDFIYTMFPLALGLSIPFSMRLKNSFESSFKTILLRSYSLILIGKYEVLRFLELNITMSKDFVFLFSFLFIIFTLSKNGVFKASLLCFLTLLCFYLFSTSDLGFVEFIKGDFGVLGNLGINYFLASLLLLFFNKRTILLITLILFLANIFIDIFSIHIPFIYRILFGGQLVVCLLGVNLCLYKNKRSLALIISFILALISFLLFGNIEHFRGSGNALYFLISAIPAILTYYFLGLKSISTKIGTLSWIGENLFAIYLLHIAFAYLCRLIGITNYLWFFSNTGGWPLVVNVFGVCILFLMGSYYLMVKKRVINIKV